MGVRGTSRRSLRSGSHRVLTGCVVQCDDPVQVSSHWVRHANSPWADQWAMQVHTGYATRCVPVQAQRRTAVLLELQTDATQDASSVNQAFCPTLARIA